MTQDDSWSVRASFKDWAWVILLVGGALGTTLPGQLLLLLVFVIEGLSRLVRRSSDGPDFEVRDLSFARLGWAFFLASLISAGFSEHPTMALAISTGFLLLFGIVALGTKSFVLSPLLERPDRLVAWILVAGVVGSLYGIYGVVELGRPRALGLGNGPNGFGGLNALLAIVATGYAVQKGRLGWWLATIPVYLVTLALTLSRGLVAWVCGVSSGFCRHRRPLGKYVISVISNGC